MSAIQKMLDLIATNVPAFPADVLAEATVELAHYQEIEWVMQRVLMQRVFREIEIYETKQAV